MGTPALFTLKLTVLRLILISLLQEAGDLDYKKLYLPWQEYDFIIVGSGAAGCVLAARLSEIPTWRVLLLESGDTPPPETYIPALDLIPIGREADWKYKTTSQSYSQLAYENQSTVFPQGRTVGGSTALNFMMYVRGNKRDYDRWADIGNQGWGYQDVLPYFKKAEDYKGPRTVESMKYHGEGGPLTVTPKQWSTPIAKAFLKAGEELGYPSIDPNGRSQTGFSSLDLTIRNGLRLSAAEAYVRPNLDRPNLHILPNAHVTRVVFNENKEAVGVEFDLRRKNRYIVRAKREVVISAGAIGSPHLLMLSGVGGAEQLNRHRIKVVQDLPGVGENLRDHPSTVGMTWTMKAGSTLDLLSFFNPQALKEFIKMRTGPYTAPFGSEGNGYAQLSGGDPEWPDMQFLIGSASFNILGESNFVTDRLNLNRQTFTKYYSPISNKPAMGIVPIILRPKSKGKVTLRSSNPYDHPNIDTNFLTDQDDVRLMIAGIKFALKIGNTTAMRTLGAEFHDMKLPGCENHLAYSDNYFECYARHLTATLYHPSSTCKMAPLSDPMGVVDPRLRVRGVKKLRVVDSSIMPEIVSGNLNAPTNMIGEKASDIIKEDWGVKIN